VANFLRTNRAGFFLAHIQNPRFLKQSISIYAYTCISVQKTPLNTKPAKTSLRPLCPPRRAAPASRDEHLARQVAAGVAKNEKISTTNPSFKKPRFLKQSISIYAYTYILKLAGLRLILNLTF